MALTKYTYSKDANITVLADEVLADAGITTVLDHIDLIDDADPDTVDIWFVDAISGAEQTALDAVVSAHTNPAVPTADHVHAGGGAPDNQLGSNGDVCLDPDTLMLYKKAAGAWDGGQSISDGPWNWQGTWVSGSYVVDDVVEHLGTCYLCISNASPGQGPPGAKWETVAAKGGDGPQGSVESDVQSSGSEVDTNTTSTTWVDVDSCSVTTSNTQALDYIVTFGCWFDASGANTDVHFRILADGVEIPYSMRHTEPGNAEGRPLSITVVSNLITGKVIKAQMETSAGTLTIHNRSLVAHGIA